MMEAINNLHGKSFIQFPDVDVFHLQPSALEQFGHGVNRADPHFIGIAARHLEAAKNQLIWNAELVSALARHQQRGGSAVRKLRRIARRNGAFSAVRIKMRLERQQAFQRCVRPVALVFVGNNFFLADDFVGLLVQNCLGHFDTAQSLS